MAQSVKVGTPIFEDDFRKTTLSTLMELTIDQDPMTVDADEVQKLMAKVAMKAENKNRNEAIELVNGFKDDWGTGISTRVMVYNALGVPLQFRSKNDSSGYWSTHTLPDRIEVGEWAVGFHHKTSGSMSGSCGVVGYNVLGYGHDEVLMIGFDTPYSGKNNAYCAIMATSKWSKTSWDKLHDWADDGAASAKRSYGRALVKHSMDNDSSPTLSVIVTRSDIGY